LRQNQLYNELSDQDLLELYRIRQNKECLGILLQRYTVLLLGVCLKYLKNEEAAKDAVQQIFAKVIVEAEKYHITHFKSWLYTVTRNQCFSQLRNKVYDLPEEALEKTGKHFSTQDDGMEHVVEKERLLSQIEDALNEIQPNQRECVSLFYLEQKSYQQIHQITGYTLLQIKSYIQNGKRNIRLLLDKRRKKNEA